MLVVVERHHQPLLLGQEVEGAQQHEPHLLLLEPGVEIHRAGIGQVVAERAPDFFSYPGQAGDLIQPPLPLSALQPCQESSGVSGPYWRDRKLAFWAKAAGNDGGASTIVMRYFYALQPGFFLPSFVPQLPVGAHVPWLDLHAGTVGIPVNVSYAISWPTAPRGPV